MTGQLLVENVLQGIIFRKKLGLYSKFNETDCRRKYWQRRRCHWCWCRREVFDRDDTGVDGGFLDGNNVEEIFWEDNVMIEERIG